MGEDEELELSDWVSMAEERIDDIELRLGFESDLAVLRQSGVVGK